MVDPHGGSAGLYYEEDEPEETPPAPRIPLKRVALVCAGIAGAALIVSGVIYGPTLSRVLAQSGTEIQSPPKVGPFTLDTTDGAKDTAEYIRDAIATKVNLDDSKGLIYHDGKSDAILIAGTARIWKPADTLKAAFDVVSDDNGGVKDTHDLDAGPLGGTVRCGTTKVDDQDLSVCGWADNGSLGVALFSSRTITDAAKSILDLRAAVEKRS